jgi:hypothetical protein
MRKITLLFAMLPLILGAQMQEGMLWTEIGVSGRVIKNLDWGAEVTTRFGSNGLSTIFPQASLKYKVNKFLRFSCDYRYIYDKQLTGYYTNSHRVNFNLDGKYQIDRFYFKARARYQYSFDRLSSSEFYEPEFDRALRGKLEVKYDVNNFILSPIINAEMFYNPKFGEFGRQINKMRIFGGFELDLKSDHEVSFGYIYDTRINLPNPRTRHIVSLSYGYTIKKKKKKEK